MSTQTPSRERIGGAAIVAVAAALLSFVVPPLWALVCAGIAGIAGLIGLVQAISPEVRGGVLSTLAIVFSGVAVVAALIRALF